MNTSLLQTAISLIIGTVIMVNGIAVNTDDILNQAKSAVNGANVHQLATALEIYYLDHEAYPNVSGGQALVDTLEQEGYIQNRPLDANVFAYAVKDGGENYSLALK